MTWMITASAREIHFDQEAGGDFDIFDIANALAKINRFNGHTSRPNSVAEHSLLCADIAEHLNLSTQLQYVMLMHDAHEAFTGDMTSPIKWLMGHVWKLFEGRMERRVHQHFGLCELFKDHRKACRLIDLMALATERRDLTSYQVGINKPWLILDQPQKIKPVEWVTLNTRRREQMHWTEWRDQFLERYDYFVAALIAENNSHGNALTRRST